MTEVKLDEAIAKLAGVKECSYPPRNATTKKFEDADFFGSDGTLQAVLGLVRGSSITT